MLFFNLGECRKPLCGFFEKGAKCLGMLARFGDLLVKLGDSRLVPFFDREMAEGRVHRGELVGFALDRNFQRPCGGQLGFRIEQVEMAKGMHHFLIGSRLKMAGGFFIAGLPSDLGEIAILDMRHRFAGKRGFEIGNRGRGRYRGRAWRGFGRCGGHLNTPGGDDA